MSSTSDAGSYRAVLALPYAAPTFGAALVGRLSYGLLPLSVLFTVQQSTGSFATAGGVVAVFGLTSILLPLKSRLVDRHGQASVLAPLALLCAGALAAMAFLAWSASAPAPAYLALGIVAGLGTPPTGPGDALNLAHHHRRQQPQTTGLQLGLGVRGVALPHWPTALRGHHERCLRAGGTTGRGLPDAARNTGDGMDATRATDMFCRSERAAAL